MHQRLEPDHIRAMRAAAQRVDSHRETSSAAQVVRHLMAVQAQDIVAASLGVAVRTDNLSISAIDTARNVDRGIVRTWCLRGTLHLLAAEDVHWILDLVRPQLVLANRRRRLELGLDDAATERGVRIVEDALGSSGPLTRGQLAERLRHHAIPSEGQAVIHVIWRAAVDGRACYGPDREGEETFVALDDWLSTRTRNTPTDKVLELARRYLAAFGPAARADFAAWSGLPRGEIRRAWDLLSLETTRVGTPYGEMLIRPEHLRARDPDSVVRLLPAFDGLWLGYSDHDTFVEREHYRRVFPGGGVVRPFVFANAHIVGSWARRTTRRGIDVSLHLFERVDERAMSAALADFERITERPVRQRDAPL